MSILTPTPATLKAMLLAFLCALPGASIAATLPATCATLAAQITAAQPGDSVQVAAGACPLLALRAVKAAPGVVIEPAPGAAVRFAGVGTSGAAGFTLRGFTVTYDPRTKYAVNIGSSERITFEGNEVVGDPALRPSGYQIADPVSGKLVPVVLVNVRSSKQIAVRDNRLHDGFAAVQHLDSDGLSVTGNDIRDIGLDGIRGGGTSNLYVARNRLTDFWPLAGWHSDAVQVWTTNTTTPTRNVVIEFNEYRRGAGAATQGIFLGNEVNIPMEGVVVRGNLMAGTIYHGIYVSTSIDTLIEDNLTFVFKGTLDAAGKPIDYSQIIFRDSASGRWSGNVANRFTLLNTSGVVGDPARPNKTVPMQEPGDYSLAETWLHRHDPPPVVLTLEQRVAALEAWRKAQTAP